VVVELYGNCEKRKVIEPLQLVIITPGIDTYRVEEEGDGLVGDLESQRLEERDVDVD
jgi:hypothetical protein